MSVEALAIALHHSRAKSATSKLVLIGIANHDGDGGSWPAVATLAEYARCSPRTVQRSIDELERLGEIRRVVGAGGMRHTANHRRPNLYQVLLRCPPDCDRSPQHKTRRNPGPQVDLTELEGLEEPSTGVTPVSPHGRKLSTGVTRVSPGGVTRVSPEPSLGTNHQSDSRKAVTDRAPERHEGWDHPCIGGDDMHQISRKTGACAFCGARRVSWEVQQA